MVLVFYSSPHQENNNDMTKQKLELSSLRCMLIGQWKRKVFIFVFGHIVWPTRLTFSTESGDRSRTGLAGSQILGIHQIFRSIWILSSMVGYGGGIWRASAQGLGNGLALIAMLVKRWAPMP